MLKNTFWLGGADGRGRAAIHPSITSHDMTWLRFLCACDHLCAAGLGFYVIKWLRWETYFRRQNTYFEQISQRFMTCHLCIRIEYGNHTTAFAPHQTHNAIPLSSSPWKQGLCVRIPLKLTKRSPKYLVESLQPVMCHKQQ